MTKSDHHLVRAWCSGDGAAFGALAERYAAALGAVAFGVLRDHTLAQDVVQETFLRAQRTPDRLAKSDGPGPYLMGIARHVALDLLRRRARERPMPAAAKLDHNSPASEAARAELRERLQEAVESLPADQKELFLMKYVGGLTYRDIARATALSEEAVGQKLWRIRKKLQQSLEDVHP